MGPYKKVEEEEEKVEMKGGGVLMTKTLHKIQHRCTNTHTHTHTHMHLQTLILYMQAFIGIG